MKELFLTVEVVNSIILRKFKLNKIFILSKVYKKFCVNLQILYSYFNIYYLEGYTKFCTHPKKSFFMLYKFLFYDLFQEPV